MTVYKAAAHRAASGKRGEAERNEKGEGYEVPKETDAPECGLAEMLKEEVIQILDMTAELDDESVGRAIDGVILRESGRRYIPLREKLRLRRELFHSIRGLDVLSELLEDPEVTEIMINGTDSIYAERRGRITRTELRFENDERLLSVIGHMVSGANRAVNETNPIMDAVLPDGSRVNIVLSGISRNGSAVTIRKFPEKAYSMDDLIKLGSLDAGTAEFLKLLVSARYNIFLSGDNDIIGLSQVTSRTEKTTAA